MGIQIKRPVYVRVVVTEQFKARRGAEIRATLAKLDAVRGRIDARMEQGTAGIDPAVLERLKAEKRRNEQASAALMRELEQVASLEPGTEYDRGTLEGSVVLEVGDDFSRMGACEIVVKDDKIIDIRDGLCPRVNGKSSSAR